MFKQIFYACLVAMVYADHRPSSLEQINEHLKEHVAPLGSMFTIDLGSLNAHSLDVFANLGLPLNAGESVRFQVSGNLSTGYRWIVREEAANGLFTVESLYVPEVRALGAGGTFYFTVEAGSDIGTGSFQIYHARPWEAENIVGSFEIPIHIIAKESGL